MLLYEFTKASCRGLEHFLKLHQAIYPGLTYFYLWLPKEIKQVYIQKSIIWRNIFHPVKLFGIEGILLNDSWAAHESSSWNLIAYNSRPVQGESKTPTVVLQNEGEVWI